MAKFVIHRCKRDEYIKAWLHMYKNNKKEFNHPMFDGINPMLNKTPLKSEIDNLCVVAYDTEVNSTDFKYGEPVGIFCMLITKNGENIKNIGKQYVVNPLYQGLGIGKAMLLETEKWLKELGYTWYYIGCSSMSTRILKSLGYEPYHSDIDHDLFKFNVDLNIPNFDDQYHKYVECNESIQIEM